MSNENKQAAAVRVCAISDVECSRGCGTGACKKEAAHDHIADARKLVAQPDERAAFNKYAYAEIGRNLTRRDNWLSTEMQETREEIARDAFSAGFRAASQGAKP